MVESTDSRSGYSGIPCIPRRHSQRRASGGCMIVMRIRGKPGNYKQGEWHWFILAGSECIAKCYEYYALDTSLGSIEEIPPAKARIILGRQLSEIARSRI